MKDCLPNTEPIFPGDIVYVYEYRNRDITTCIDDMNRITVVEAPVVYRAKDNYVLYGVDEEDKTHTGILAYKVENNLIKTSEGMKYINYFVEDNRPRKCLRKFKEGQYLQLYLIFKVHKVAEIIVPLYPDILFNSEENLQKFTLLTSIKKPEISMHGISFELNDEVVEMKDYIICLNEQEYDSDEAKRNLFQYLCENKKDKENKTFSYNKKFSMKFSGFSYGTLPLPI